MRMIDADVLQREYMKYHNGKRIVLVDVAPTINQWILVSERLPEEPGAYICSCKDGNRDMVSMIRYQPRQKSWNLTGQRAYWRVIAWMPLPDPWKGEEE